MSNPVEMKVVLVGAVGVGKTSTVNRFVKDSFKDYVDTTIGASYMTKTLHLGSRLEPVKFSVWDTAGQEQYHSLIPLYFRKAAAVIVVFDITREQTFEDAKRWVKDLKNQAPEDAFVAIVGNKSDLKDIRQVDTATADEFAKSVGAIYGETSAKEDAKSITYIFEQLGEKFLSKVTSNRLIEEEPEHIELSDIPPEKERKPVCAC